MANAQFILHYLCYNIDMRKYKDYTDQQIIDAVKASKSISQVLKVLGLKQAGGNYANVQRNIQRLLCDTSHFTGKGWNKDQQLKDWSSYSKAANLKPHLIKKRTHQCEQCNLSEWLSEQIKLEIHHIDGDRTNNVEENLQLLCPNCHSMTDSWRKANHLRKV